MKVIFAVIVILYSSLAIADFEEDARQNTIKAMRSMGLDKELDAGVEVTVDENGVTNIRDNGTFLVQYMIVGPEDSLKADIQIEAGLKIKRSCKKAVIVTHGWIDRGSSGWPEDVAAALYEKIDPNDWFCAYYDWRGGAGVINPVEAAKYGRDIAGPRLADAIIKLAPGGRFEHVHLVGHSAGSWTISSAARLIAKETRAVIHLTFLDAYIPPKWDAEELADIKSKSSVWAEHYFTKDITAKVTHIELPKVFNVDITDVDPLFKEHEFPYRWYFGTITGRYKKWIGESNQEVLNSIDGVYYGFTRSLESGPDNWEKSLLMKPDQKAVKLRKPENPFIRDLKSLKLPFSK